MLQYENIAQLHLFHIIPLKRLAMKIVEETLNQFNH